MLDHSCTSQVATPAQGDAELTECATSIGSVGTGTNELTAANLPAEVRDYYYHNYHHYHYHNRYHYKCHYH